MRQCDENVTHDGWHFHRCSHKAKYVVDGDKYFCGIHARHYLRYWPEAIKEITPERVATEASENQTGVKNVS